MDIIFILIALILIITFFFVMIQSFTNKQKFQQEDTTIQLDDAMSQQQLKQYLESEDDLPVFIFIHADWCGHCQAVEESGEMTLMDVASQESCNFKVEKLHYKNPKVKELKNIIGFPTFIIKKNEEQFIVMVLEKLVTGLIKLKI